VRRYTVIPHTWPGGGLVAGPVRSCAEGPFKEPGAERP